MERVLELTDGKGAEVILDFVGERGAERDSWAMTHRAGSDFVIGYGVEWREANKDDRDALRRFECTTPAPKEPGRRARPHPKPWGWTFNGRAVIVMD